jgi:hypothetical protein
MKVYYYINKRMSQLRQNLDVSKGTHPIFNEVEASFNEWRENVISKEHRDNS